jgi:hypothetical protein
MVRNSDKITPFFVMVLVMTSCSGSWHLNQALRKDPSIIQADTVVSMDTTWIVIPRVDTIFKSSIDTVVFQKDSVIVKYFYNHSDSMVYIETDCPDCPEITKEVILPQVVIQPTFWDFMRKWGWLLVVAFFVGFFVRRR